MDSAVTEMTAGSGEQPFEDSSNSWLQWEQSWAFWTMPHAVCRESNSIDLSNHTCLQISNTKGIGGKQAYA